MGWFHDGSAAGQGKLGFGNNWVVAAIIVTLPFVSRPVALPVLAALAVKGGDRSKPELARDLVDSAERFGDRAIPVVGDAAYACGSFAGLGHDMTMTTRARCTAVFAGLAPPRTGKRGRPRLKGNRIGTPADIARSAIWKTVTLARYGTTATVQVTERGCLWYGTWRTDPIRVILVREGARKARTSGDDIALVTTDLDATPEEIITRYAARWSIEVTFFDVTNILGVGQARNRVAKPSNGPSPSDCSATVCSSSGTHSTATPPPTPHGAGPPRRGTRPRPSPPPSICSPHFATRSSPPDFCPHP